ncbi:hypothetical protein, partial [Plasmodium yoelii yoelii]
FIQYLSFRRTIIKTEDINIFLFYDINFYNKVIPEVSNSDNYHKME